MPHVVLFEQSGRDLVQQRLERAVVVLVDQDDLGVGVLELPCGADSREPTAEDENARLVRRVSCGDDSLLSVTRHPAWRGLAASFRC